MDPYTVHAIIRDSTIVAITAIALIGFPMARAYGRRMEKMGRDSKSLSTGEAADARLERVERAVEAMALEIERIAEGQRFMTKLLGDANRPRSTAREG